jgi:hypothetical protein
VTAHDGSGDQRGAYVVGQPLEAAGDDVGDALRRVLLGEQGGEVALLAGEPCVLQQEERVAVGAGPKCIGLDT